MTDIAKLEQKRTLLESERTGVELVWQLIEQFIFPFRGEFFGGTAEEGSVDWRRREIYDGTAAIANQNLAANMNSGLTNSLYQWFQLKLRNKELNANKEVKDWLQRSAARIFEELQDSNFELKANETYLDLPSYGIGAQVEEVDENPDGSLKEIIFSSIPVGEYVFETDINGRLINFWRKLNMSIVQLEEKFGYWGLPAKIQEKIDSKQVSTEKEEVIFCIFRRKDVDAESKFSVIDPLSRPFGKIYYLVAGEHELGSEGGYYEMPVYLPRWRTTSGSVWGNSPAMLCLSNILSLNELLEYILKNAEKNVDPPTVGTKRGVIGDVDLSAGGHTTVRSIKDLVPFLSGADFRSGEMNKADLRDMINRTFFMDQLQLKESPAMTATEVNARFQLMQRLLGPTLNRLQVDWLDPLIQRTFGIMFRYKELPEMPQILLDNEANLDIEYTGPMAKAQQEVRAAAIEQFLGTTTALLEAFPDIRRVPKAAELVEELAELRGISVDMLNSKAEQNTGKQAEQKAMQDQQTLDQAEQGVGVMEKATRIGAEAGGQNTEAA